MKNLALLLPCLLLSTALFSQKIDYNLDGGYLAEGYDLVAYFDQSPTKGSKQFVYTDESVKLKFSSQKNLDAFKSDPKKYLPQYGGWCAYAMAKNKKVSIDPQTYEIRDGKLYLFYNSFFNNTLESWTEEGPEKLKKLANSNWQKLKSDE